MEVDMVNIILVGVSNIIFGGLGYYVGQRGLAGIKVDLANVKKDFENIKEKISAEKTAAEAVVLQTPVV